MILSKVWKYVRTEITAKSVESLSRDNLASVHCQTERSVLVQHYAVFSFTLDEAVFVGNNDQVGYGHSGR